MKIKGKGVLRTEQITCRVLVFISAIAFALCIVMEYCFPLFINDFYCEFFHLDFLKNVMLGISGSSIISFICIIFPYLKKKKDFIKNIISQMESIFVCYLNIYEQMGEEIKKDDAETYGFEIKLYKAAQELLEKIELFVIDYRKFDWESKDIFNLIIFLGNNVTINLQAVKQIVSWMVPEEYGNNPLEIPKNLKRDITLKRFEKDICYFYLNIRDYVLEMKMFKKEFKKFKIEEIDVRLKEEATNQLKQKMNEIDEKIRKWNESDRNRKINHIKFDIDLMSEHIRQYEDRIDNSRKIIDDFKSSD